MERGDVRVALALLVESFEHKRLRLLLVRNARSTAEYQVVLVEHLQV